jgi:hypothetical protein
LEPPPGYRSTAIGTTPSAEFRALGVAHHPSSLLGKYKHMIIDAWGQHPTLRHSSDPIFDSLRPIFDTSSDKRFLNQALATLLQT